MSGDSTTSLFCRDLGGWRARWLTAHDEPSRRAFERLGKGLGTLPRNAQVAKFGEPVAASSRNYLSFQGRVGNVARPRSERLALGELCPCAGCAVCASGNVSRIIICRVRFTSTYETDDTAPEPHTPLPGPLHHSRTRPVHTHTPYRLRHPVPFPRPVRALISETRATSQSNEQDPRIARTDYTAVVLREFRSETRPSVPPFMTSCARRSPHCIRLVSVASTAGPHYENRNRRSSSESWPSAFASPPTVPSKTRRFLSCSRRMRSSTVLRTTNRTARMGLC